MQHLCRCTCLRCAGQERVQGTVRGLRVRGRVRGWVGGEAMQFLSLRWCRCFGCRMRPLSHFPSFLFRNTLERELRWMCRVGDVISNTNLVGQYTVWLARAEGWMVSVGPASTDYIIILDVHDFVCFQFAHSSTIPLDRPCKENGGGFTHAATLRSFLRNGKPATYCSRDCDTAGVILGLGSLLHHTVTVVHINN